MSLNKANSIMFFGPEYDSWQTTYSTVTANSATWNSGNASVNTFVQSNSATITAVDTTVTSSSGNWNTAYTTVTANSGNWLQTLTFTPSSSLLSISNGNSVSLSGIGLTGFKEISSYVSPNQTVPVNGLSAVPLSGSPASIDVVITPKGAGAFILGPPPDGSSAAGDKRGQYAVDLQLTRNNNTKIASGYASFVAGEGSLATASNAVAMGKFAAAGGAHAFAVGYRASASGTGAIALGSSWANANADHAIALGPAGYADKDILCFSTSTNEVNTLDTQFCAWTRAGKTTNNTPVIISFPITSKSMMTGILIVQGIKSTGASVAIYTRKVAIKNVAGTTSLCGVVETIGTDITDSATNLSITSNDTTDTLDITVTGIASETWRWAVIFHGALNVYGT